MFSEKTLQDLKNISLYEVQEIKTMLYGRCYTICCLQKVKIVDYSKIIQLKTTFDLTVYVHQKHEEFWVKMFGTPRKIFVTRLSVQGDLFGADLILAEKHVRLLDKENAPCKSYSQNDDNNEEIQSFIHCAQKSILNNVGNNLICILPFMSDWISNSTLSECSSRSDSVKTFQIYSDFIHDFNQNMDSHGCPMPCSLITYNVATKYIHKNVQFNFNEQVQKNTDDLFGLALIYDTLLIDKNVESYEYDSSDFLIYVGGNLGLFLGFSCLSTLIALLRYVSSFCLKK